MKRPDLLDVFDALLFLVLLIGALLAAAIVVGVVALIWKQVLS